MIYGHQISSPLPWARAMKITPGPKAAIIPGNGGRGAFLKGGRVSPDSLCAIRSDSLDLVDSSLGECAEQFLKGPV